MFSNISEYKWFLSQIVFIEGALLPAELSLSAYSHNF